MQEYGKKFSDYGVERHGITESPFVYWNLTPGELYEEAVQRSEGLIVEDGPLLVHTGKYTGRSPNDKFIVRERTSEDKVWWGNVNHPLSEDKYTDFSKRFISYVNTQNIFVQDVYAGTDPEHRLAVRLISNTAWQSLYAHNMFIQPTAEEQEHFNPQFLLISCPSFKSDPQIDGTNSEVAVVINFGEQTAFVAGSSYAGEIKKTIFTIMNYLMPNKGVLSMHCSANIGEKEDAAILFGLSGTGKTTLSTDPDRRLIGDDEHGWGKHGIFNFEGGCYAKVINLSREDEPEIFAATHKFGTILENVVYEPETRKIDLNDNGITENTRASYPLSSIDNIEDSGRGDHPKNIIFLTADAFGILPPISKLTPQQAMYHFLSGYTAKVAGTEKGITEPIATFSTCFGAPFMVHQPTVYANMLGDLIKKHKVNCWLVNTGWSGGAYGVGSRMKIAYTRTMVHTAILGELDSVSYTKDVVFGVFVPDTCENVPCEVLHPRQTWDDKKAYDETAARLADMFKKNFEQFRGGVPSEILAAGPK
ncbi:MAG: phosphoenolpyruvate carboxykinase (ATP) [Anaerolineaceae bacterium]|nr:phosphoenolpyruvate carboxykinase (ATP) [Anaerolineaceae bacterium]